MSTPIRIKRSAVPGKIPTTADLQLSELAINTYDGKIYLKRDQSGVETVLTAGSGYPGNTYYVSKAGLDTNDGKSLSSSLLTLKYALSIAVSGDTVQISAGTYSEIFPLTVPQGVTIQGNGLRSTFIQPTVGTQRLDAFLLNGETTIQDLSVGNFYYNSSANTGYGFRFANNMITTIRSPYIQRVTVLNRGSLTSESDPYGYDTPDNYPSSLVSGRGVLIDGSVVQSTTLEPAILFNECTFITPNQTSLRMINGARSEWVNCFTYFSSKGIEGISGPVGVASTANITLRLSGITTSSLSQNYVIKYYQSGSPVAIGTIVSTSGIVTNTPYITLLGKGSGVFNSVGIGSVQDIRIFQSNGSTQVGTASTILWADYQKFGADLRSIGSADNFGEYGVNADGPGVQLRLFGFNFGCVGSGKTFTQDPTLTVKSNEAIQSNGGRVYFQSVDQAGNFRVGNIFEISQETGAVSLASTSDITINGTATIQNLIVSGLSTFFNPVEFDSNLFVSGISTFNNNVKVTGFTTFVSDSMFSNNLNVAGISTLTNLRVTGISTLTGDTEFTNNVRVSGISTLTTLRVTGISTLTGDTEFTNNVRVSGISTLTNLIVTGVSTLTTLRVTGISTLTGDTEFTNNVRVSGITTATTLRVTGISTLSGDVQLSNNLIVSGVSTFNNNVTISGNLFVDGTTTTIDSVNLMIEDKNIGIGSTSYPTDVTANGGGITLFGSTNKTFAWVAGAKESDPSFWTSSENISLVSGKTFSIDGITVLSSTSLGIGITNSVLQRLGSLHELNVIGISTFTGAYATDLRVTGFSTFTNYYAPTGTVGNFISTTSNIQTLYVNSGIFTSFTGINVGIDTLHVNIGIVTDFNSDYLYTDSTTVGIKTASSILGISTDVVGINTTGIIVGDIVTATSIPAGTLVIGFSSITTSVIISNLTLNTSGISTEDIGIYRSNNAGIGSISTLRVNSGIVTSATITRLNVSGIATITNLNVSNVVIGVATVGSFISTDVYVTGITTADLLYSNSGIVTNLNVTRLNVTGIATLANLRSTDVEIIGISTIKNIRIDSGIATDFSGKYLTYTNTSSVIVSSSITIGISTNRIGITTTNVQVGDSITSVGGDFSNSTQVTSIEPGIVVFSPNSGNLSISTSLVSITRSNNVGIVTASTLYVNSGVATVFDITQSIIGVGTISRLISSGILVSGITTTNSLYSNTGIITHVSGTNLNYTGIATLTTAALTNLYSISGIVTHISGTNIAYSGIGTIDQLSGSGIAYTTANIISIGASDLIVSGVSTLTNILVNSGIVTFLSGTNLSYSGIGTINTLYSNIGFTTYLSGTNLNYVGVGSITTLIGTGVTFNSADFTDTRTTSLYGTGIGSIATLYVNSGFVTTLSGTQVTYTNANVTGITTSSLVYSNVGVVTFISGTNIAYSGIGTIDQLSGTGIAYTSADLTHVRSQNIRATGIGTIDSLYSNVGVVTTLSGTRSTYQDIDNTNLYTSGVGSISTLKSNVGLVTFVSGTNLSYSGVGTITSLYGSDIAYSGVGTIGTLYSNIGFVTTLSGTNLNYSGISSIQNLYANVGVVTFISGTNLNYSGVGTITQILSVNAQNSGIITSSSLHIGVGGSIISVVSGIGSVGIGTTAAKEKLNIYGNLLYSNNVTTGTSRVGIATTSLTTIHEAFSRLEYRSVEYQIQASCSGAGNTGRYQFTKILSIHDGTTAFNVEYSTVGTGTDVSSYVVDIDEGLDAGYIRLQAAPAQVGITSYVVHYVAYKL